MRIRKEYKKWLDSLKKLPLNVDNNNSTTRGGYAPSCEVITVATAKPARLGKEEEKENEAENQENGTGDGYESTGSNSI